MKESDCLCLPSTKLMLKNKIIIINQLTEKTAFPLVPVEVRLLFYFLFWETCKWRLPWKWMNSVEFPDSEDKQSSQILSPPNPYPVSSLRPQSGPPSAPTVYQGAGGWEGQWGKGEAIEKGEGRGRRGEPGEVCSRGELQLPPVDKITCMPAHTKCIQWNW